MAKSPDAFRTISEVSDALDTPAHVLRFWESKFRQIKPVKRAGGRRYYRPDDLALLAGIKDLLHGQGHSIKDAQKMLRGTVLQEVIARGYDLLGDSSDAEDSAVDAPMMPPPVMAPADQSRQPDLFAGMETPAPAQPALRVVPDTPPRASASAAGLQPAPSPRKLPDLPAPRDDVPPRVLATLLSATPGTVQANAARIAPLVQRLTALRDDMRQPW